MNFGDASAVWMWPRCGHDRVETAYGVIGGESGDTMAPIASYSVVA